MTTRNASGRRAFMTATALAIILASASVGRCSPVQDLHPGARVRIDAPSMIGHVDSTLVARESDQLTSNPCLVGRVRAAVADTITLSNNDGLHLVAIPCSAIQQLYIWKHRGHETAGKIIGTVMGAVIGGVLANEINRPERSDQGSDGLPNIGPPPHVTVGVLFGAGFGFVAGGLVGGSTSKGQWVPVDLRPIRSGVLPSP